MQQIRKKFPYFFLVVIAAILIFLYVVFVWVLLLGLRPWAELPTAIYAVFYHVVVVLLVWSIVVATWKDPGKVPMQWGFGLNNQTRKYCLICHVFKPERTHHCSSCGRCVLNMDHHCPWINTCIGFHNRKPFILMLIYTTLATLLNALSTLLSLPGLIKTYQEGGAGQMVKLVLIVGAFFLNMVILVTIAIFLKYHLQLIFSNYTTLETLELKRQGREAEQCPSDYDIGRYYNWVQVFGRSSCTWPIPVFCGGEGPAGDGVLWPRRPQE